MMAVLQDALTIINTEAVSAGIAPLDLAPLPRHKALGVAHFPRFYDAMEWLYGWNVSNCLAAF